MAAGVPALSADDRLRAVRDFVAKMASACPAYVERAEVEAVYGALDAVSDEMAARRETESRLDEVAEALYRVASLDFEQRLELRADGSVLDAVVGCINMLSEELRAHLDERSRIEVGLEERVLARTAELNAALDRYRLLVESTNAVVWEAEGSQLTVSYISPQAASFFGQPSARFVGNGSVWECTHGNDRERVMREMSGLAGSAVGELHLEYRVVRADGRIIDVQTTVSAERNRDGRLTTLRGITLDVTRRKQIETDLQHAQKLESIGRLASGVAHEINTPVQFVGDSINFLRDASVDLVGVVKKLQEVQLVVLEGGSALSKANEATETWEAADVPYLLENMPKAFDRVIDGLDRISTIVRSMKEFAHPDSKEMTTTDLNRAIETTLTIARNEYKYVAELQTEFEPLPLVYCHVGEFNQVILNIVVNAAHAIGNVVEGTARRGCIRVRTRQDGEDVVVSIGDTGGGIPDEIRERIFDPFFTTKEVGRGTGQGLAIARSVVEKHHGQLRFETEVGKGTTFFVRLPISGRPRRSAPQAAA
jgi:PAS domain S-box-containing protein